MKKLNVTAGKPVGKGHVSIFGTLNFKKVSDIRLRGRSQTTFKEEVGTYYLGSPKMSTFIR